MKNILMNINFNMNFLSKLAPYLYIGLFFFVLNFALSLFLTKDGVEYYEKNDSQMKYLRYDYYKNNIKKLEEKKEKKVFLTLDTYKLTGIYKTKKGGVIALVDKAKKSFILSIDEKIDGFILKEIYSKYVLFKKNSKTFKLELKDSEDKDKAVLKKKIEDNNYKVQRTTINNMLQNPQSVFKDIAIVKKAIGFRINKLKANSFFTKLGLKRGDVIKKVNNKNLDSFNDVMNILSKIQELNYLKIELLRNNKITELNYEIN